MKIRLAGSCARERESENNVGEIEQVGPRLLKRGKTENAERRLHDSDDT